MSADLSRLLRPTSIAVVGGKQAEEVIRQCHKIGYQGKIWPVHPRKNDIQGLKVFDSVNALPAAPDACFVGVNRKLTTGIVRDLAAMGAGGAVCYASGFLEADEEGGTLQADLLEAAGEMPILGPNCYGFINYADGAMLWPDQHGGLKLEAEEAGVAIITQSSNIAINFTMQRRGLPLAYLMTAGNQAQIGVSEMALALLDDPRVTTLGMHIEGFDSVPGMEAVAAKSQQLKKPVVAMKVGKSEQAQAATLSHTASLAGSDAACDAFFKRVGIGRVHSIPVLMETLKFLHVHGALNGYRLTSMSCSGGEASIMADAAETRRVHFPAFSVQQKNALTEVLGPLVTVANPLDYQTYIWNDEEKMQRVFSTVLGFAYDLNCLVLDFPHSELCDDRDWLGSLSSFEKACENYPQSKAVVVASLPENLPETYIRRLTSKGIAAIGGFEELLNAAEVSADIASCWNSAGSAPVMSVTSGGSVSEKQAHDEAEAKQLLFSYGVSIPAGGKVESVSTALAVAEKIGYPVVVKQLGIAHKTEADAVRLNLCDAGELAAATESLLKLGDSLYLERMIQNGVAELIIGLVRDKQFGMVMTVGCGGVLVEILKDSVSLLLPAGRNDFEQALCSLKMYPILQGYRGKPAADIPAVIDAMMAIQQFALDHPDSLQELDVNPLIVCEKGKGAFAADALILYT